VDDATLLAAPRSGDEAAFVWLFERHGAALVRVAQLYVRDRAAAEEVAQEACSGCRSYVDQMRRTVRTLGRLRQEDLPAPVAPELLGVFRDWKRRR
jgi:DNA-directed RNA polymerase specialized sigma24 family protein